MTDDLIRLLRKETGDDLSSARLAVSIRTGATPEAVWNEVRSFAPGEGWLCLTDRVVAIRSPQDLAAIDGGIILSGEMVKGAESLHIRQAAEGWILSRLKAGEGDECLMFRDSFVSTEDNQQLRLSYEVYWRQQADSLSGTDGYQPYAFRFAGFSKGGENA